MAITEMRALSPTELRQMLGRSAASWAALVDYVRAHYRVQEQWAHEGEGGCCASAREYPDGRWIRIPVRALRDIADIERLVVLKAGPPTPTEA